MKAEIIAVGTELLLGQVVNTNATFLSEELAALGIDVYYHTVVGDNDQRLAAILEQAQQRSDLIVLSGGLGPTTDDITEDVVAAHIHRPLEIDPADIAKLEQYFVQTGRTMTKNNLRQALTIVGGTTIPNSTGLAIGTLVEADGTHYLLLPGPPNEMQPMFRQHVRALLAQRFPQTEQLISVVLRFYGIGESQLVTEIKELIEQQTNPTIAPYAKSHEVTLRLTVKTANPEEGKRLLANTEAKIMEQVGDYFYGYGDDNSLARVTVDLLKAHHKTVTAAESLTAGLFQSTLGEISGVSEVFKGGFVTYSPETKHQYLHIPEELLTQYGTVSKECAVEMAEQARSLTEADYGLSFTGVAEESIEGQKTGTVWIGLAVKDEATVVECFHFNRDRNFVRSSAVMRGLDMLRRAILNKK